MDTQWIVFVIMLILNAVVGICDCAPAWSQAPRPWSQCHAMDAGQAGGLGILLCHDHPLAIDGSETVSG